MFALQTSFDPSFLDQPTRWNKQRRRYQIFRELVTFAAPRKGGLPNKSGCHNIIRDKYPMNYTRFCEHFNLLVKEGLVQYEDVGSSTVTYIPQAIWQAPEWLNL